MTDEEKLQQYDELVALLATAPGHLQGVTPVWTLKRLLTAYQHRSEYGEGLALKISEAWEVLENAPELQRDWGGGSLADALKLVIRSRGPATGV